MIWKEELTFGGVVSGKPDLTNDVWESDAS